MAGIRGTGRWTGNGSIETDISSCGWRRGRHGSPASSSGRSPHAQSRLGYCRSCHQSMTSFIVFAWCGLDFILFYFIRIKAISKCYKLIKVCHSEWWKKWPIVLHFYSFQKQQENNCFSIPLFHFIWRVWLQTLTEEINWKLSSFLILTKRVAVSDVTSIYFHR